MGERKPPDTAWWRRTPVIYLDALDVLLPRNNAPSFEPSESWRTRERGERLAADEQRILDEPLAFEPPEKRKGKRRRGAERSLYPREKVKRALELSRNGCLSQEQIAGYAELSRKAVRRIQRLERAGALTLGPHGGLRLAGNPGDFRPAHKDVSLRALETARGLDPMGG